MSSCLLASTVRFTSRVTSTSILGTHVIEYAHSNGSSSVVSSSSSSLCPVTPGLTLPWVLLPVVESSRANKRPASCPNPWASLAVWPNGRSVEVVGEGSLSQRHIQPLTMPRAHMVCEYSLGNRHCPQWISPNCR